MELYQGDCLEIMKKIPDGSVDMILTDPPYGTTRNNWDAVVDFDAMWEAFRRVIKPGGAMLIFTQLPYMHKVIASNEKQFRYEWIWQKTNATGFLNARRMPLKAHENILVFYDKLPTYNPQMREGFDPYYVKTGESALSNTYGYFAPTPRESKDGSRFPIDVLQYKSTARGGGHPTQKPVPLLEYLIKTYTNENETILDPFMGSGSTGVAARNTGRNFIGIELDGGYFDIAGKRIQNGNHS